MPSSLSPVGAGIEGHDTALLSALKEMVKSIQVCGLRAAISVHVRACVLLRAGLVRVLQRGVASRSVVGLALALLLQFVLVFLHPLTRDHALVPRFTIRRRLCWAFR